MYSQEEVEEMAEAIKETAEEEIERTSQEAVRAVAAELGAELASEEKKARLYEEKCLELERINLDLQGEMQEVKEKQVVRQLGFCCGGFAAGFLLAILGAAIF